MNIKYKIDKYYSDLYNVDLDKDYKLNKLDASSLFNLKRIDLISKYKYIEYLDKNISVDYYKNMYKEIISAFSDGKYIELGNQNKNSIDDYLYFFDKLIYSIKNNGFKNNISVVPVNKNGIIIDGSHRTSICAYYNKKIDVVCITDSEINYDLNYFKKKLVKRTYLDNMCLEYAKLKNNIHVLCVFDNRKLDNLNIFYKKIIKFTDIGLFNIFNEIGVKLKRKTIFIIVEDDINKYKDEDLLIISDKLIIDKLLKLILNNNSIKMFNKTNFNELNENINLVNKLKIDKDKMIINLDDNSILIDNELYIKIKSKKMFSNTKYSAKDIDNLIYNPDNYFYYKNYKFTNNEILNNNYFVCNFIISFVKSIIYLINRIKKCVVKVLVKFHIFKYLKRM